MPELPDELDLTAEEWEAERIAHGSVSTPVRLKVSPTVHMVCRILPIPGLGVWRRCWRGGKPCAPWTFRRTKQGVS